ncbi:MAG: hypothetical protein K0R38_7877 [Polyangiaceae bacterium]|nr:hypothetical protein [Polyangiaceae bacterium]
MADDGEKTRKPDWVSRSSLRIGVTAEPMQGESRGTFDDKRLMAWSCACGWHGTSRELNGGPDGLACPLCGGDGLKPR